MPFHPYKDTENCLEGVSGTRQTEGGDTDIIRGQSDADESSSFLDRKLKDGERYSRRTRPQRIKSVSTPLMVTLVPWVINFILAIALVSLSWKTASSRTPTSHQPPTDLMYALAADQIDYRLETTYASQDSPESDYQGWPDDEKDRLWEDYEKGNRIRIDREMAEKLPYTTVQVPLEEYKDDFLVGLSVFHDLHCLSSIRKAFYPHRYNSSLVDGDGKVDYSRWHHIDHCIETIRRALTCHADTAAMTYDWIEDSQLTSHSDILHTCRNFELIRDWAFERYVPVHQRSHVEGGKVVDYVGKPYGPDWEKIKFVVPEDWEYTEKDM
ncbi:hypothetical protein VSDG_02340 [Cytospora chrysosperma]|uniref:Tat pathway signal sequence n=1 Tax=Cytospora chrysosperma TaxID=252740 RepID=A0A423WFF4_CYTCH|nr:hypothetical protein VSDG_02340 [Valsa sordida]